MKTLDCIAATLVALSLAVPGAAVAGQKNKNEVVISSSQGIAHGTMGSARNSRDSTQQIGCFMMVSTRATPYTLGACSAYDADGNAASCIFVDRPIFEKMVASISDDSYLVFGWNGSAQCVQITVAHDSAYEPRAR